MNSDGFKASITGTATFEQIRIEEKGDLLRVYGQYNGDPESTIYEFERGRLRIGGLEVTVQDEPVVVEPEDDGWVWVEATEGTLNITDEKP